jgi:hypothetical protein
MFVCKVVYGFLSKYFFNGKPFVSSLESTNFLYFLCTVRICEIFSSRLLLHFMCHYGFLKCLNHVNDAERNMKDNMVIIHMFLNITSNFIVLIGAYFYI